MNFLNPFFLFGLIAVAVPVVIHLINLSRPKKISFSTLAFFNELRKTTIRRIRIKKYLLMALRALALLMLALALARPILPSGINGSAKSAVPKAVAIIIDNSSSMQRLNQQGLLIDRAKNIADRIIRNANRDDKFYITSTNGENAGLGEFESADQSQTRLSEITSTVKAQYSAESMANVLRKMEEAPQAQGIVYVISDGQISQFEGLEQISSEKDKTSSKSISTQLIQLSAGKQQNLAVESVKLENQIISSGSPIVMSVQVMNTGSVEAANQFVSLKMEGEIVGQHEISLSVGEKQSVSFQLVPQKTGDITGRIVVEGDELIYDNEHFFVLNIPQKRSVLLLSNSREASSFKSYLEPALDAASKTNSQFSIVHRTLNEVNNSDFGNYDAIIFDGMDEIPEYWQKGLQQYVQNGGGILFFPSETGDINNYNRFLSQFGAPEFSNVLGEYGSFKSVTKMGTLEEGHPILGDIFRKEENEELKIERSSIFYYYQAKNGSGSVNLLETTDGSPLLFKQPFGKGMLLVSTIGNDPGWSNLPVNPLFAPFYYRTVLYASSTESAGLREHTLGTPFVWNDATESTEAVLQLNGVEYKGEIRRRMDGTQITYPGREWKPGIVSVKEGDGSSKIAVNKNIMESRFDTLTNSRWKQMLGDIGQVNDILSANSLSADDLESKLKASIFGKEIWNWFIWIALLFLIVETVVSRLYKAEAN